MPPCLHASSVALELHTFIPPRLHSLDASPAYHTSIHPYLYASTSARLLSDKAGATETRCRSRGGRNLFNIPPASPILPARIRNQQRVQCPSIIEPSSTSRESHQSQAERAIKHGQSESSRTSRASHHAQVERAITHKQNESSSSG